MKSSSKLSKNRKIIRLLIPLFIVVAWVVYAAVSAPYLTKISQLSSSDLATFLPKDTESSQVKNVMEEFADTNAMPALIVFASDSPLTPEQLGQIDSANSAMDKTNYLNGNVSAPVLSEDGKAALVVAPLKSDLDFSAAIDGLHSAILSTDTNLEYKFTGPAMFARDLNQALSAIDGPLLFVALAVVFVILLVVYRSPILPVISLLTAVFALSGAVLIVYHLVDNGLFLLNGQVQGILFILVIGATTDYALLYIARYREELARNKSAWTATIKTWKRSWEPIVAAGGTVTLGLLCLLFSGLESNKALGPVGSIGIVTGIITALTFLPAALLLLGRKAFWPNVPQVMDREEQANYEKEHPVWAKIGGFVKRHSRRLWVGLSIILIALSFFAPQMRIDGVDQTEMVVGQSETRDGQQLINRHFPAGTGSPIYIIAPAQDMEDVTKLLDKNPHVVGVVVMANSPQIPVLPLGNAAKNITPEQAMAMQSGMFGDVSPKHVGGNVLMQATLDVQPGSLEAQSTVRELRSSIQPNYKDVKFGGVSAIQLDTTLSSKEDIKVVVPLILVAITLVLIVLLRSIVAPLVLLATTIVSFGTAMGVSALLFNNVLGYPGSDPAIMIFSFVFLVALGIDYNIFLMTRAREEASKEGASRGMIKALIVTGGVISSAGIVLASTFATLYVIPLLFLAQVAFIVAFGVLLDTLIVRTLIVPSLTLEMGRFMWWPSKLSRKK